MQSMAAFVKVTVMSKTTVTSKACTTARHSFVTIAAKLRLLFVLSSMHPYATHWFQS